MIWCRFWASSAKLDWGRFVYLGIMDIWGRLFKRFTLSFLFLLVLVVGVGGGLVPSSVLAQDDDSNLGSSPWMCWNTGPLPDGFSGIYDDWVGEEGFGRKELFVWDFEDNPQADPAFEFEPESSAWEKWSTESDIALFSSLPEAVEYKFSFDVRTHSSDLDGSTFPLEEVMKACVGSLGTCADVPWGDGISGSVKYPWSDGGGLWTNRREAYLEQRSVAHWNSGVIDSYKVGWADPDLPSGGVSSNTAAVVSDLQAGEADLVVATNATAGSGLRVLNEIADTPAVSLASQTTATAGGTTITYNTNTTSSPTTVTTHSAGTDQNSGEVFAHDLTDTERTVDGQQILIEADAVPENTVADRTGGERGSYDAYGVGGQQDTGTDRIVVRIEIEPNHRRDYLFDYEDWGERLTLGMGPNVWTEPGYGTDHGRYNAVSGETANSGYRQPTLSRAYWEVGGSVVDTLSMTPANVEHIRWPSSIEDLNWYLHDLPDTEHRGDGAWLTWVHQDGAKKLVESGYSDRAVDSAAVAAPDLIECLVDSGAETPDGVVVTRDNIDCTFPAGVAVRNTGRGDVDGGYYPFDTDTAGDEAGSLVLREDLLVKAGVVRPVGIYDGGIREMNLFHFSIQEGNAFGDVDPVRVGPGSLRRYGVPTHETLGPAYIEGWPNGPINPNRPYLLVVTFYESANPEEGVVGTREIGLKYDKKGSFDSNFEYPARHIRRVVCRLYIPPDGIVASEQENVVVRAVKRLGGVVSAGLDVGMGFFSDMFSNAIGALGELPGKALSLLVSGGCVAIDKLNELSDPQNRGVLVQAEALDQYGGFGLNELVEDRNEAILTCQGMTEPDEIVCDVGVATLRTRGNCVALPKLSVNLVGAHFYPYGIADPIEIVPSRTDYGGADFGGTSFDVQGRDPYLGAEVGADGSLETIEVTIEALSPFGVENLGQLSSYQKGLTRVNLGWDAEYSHVSDQVYDLIDGFVVWVEVDRQLTGLAPGLAKPYVLPRFVTRSINRGTTPVPTDTVEVTGLNFGSMGEFLVPVARFSNALYEYEEADALDLPNGVTYQPLGVEVAQLGYRQLAGYGTPDEPGEANGWPLMPGFDYKVWVQPYGGVADSPGDVVLGPLSDPYLVDGAKAACYSERDPATGAFLAYDDIGFIYQCENVEVGSGVGLAVASGGAFGGSLLGLARSEICVDFFTSTPAYLTWDNKFVKRGWGLIWVIAGAVFFVLCVWHGLRMTYDVWIDPQPSFGFREMVPRALIALTLAAGSLFICQLAIVLASDLSCFVSQATGISLWGVFGKTVGVIGDLLATMFVDNYGWSPDDPIAGFIRKVLAFLLIAVIILVFLIIVLYLFVKVLFGMLMRLALISVLIVVAPLAFVLYASDTTSHWTKTWISMFLGALFQQVMVIIVLYVGFGMIGDYFSDVGEPAFSQVIMSFILSILLLSLADKVPSIINPKGSGVFSSLSAPLMLAVSGAMLAVGAGVGAGAGGAGGFMGGGGAAGAGGAGGAAGAGGAGGAGGGAGGSMSMGIPAGRPGGGPGGVPSGGGGRGDGQSVGVSPLSGLGGSTFSGSTPVGSGVGPTPVSSGTGGGPSPSTVPAGGVSPSAPGAPIAVEPSAPYPGVAPAPPPGPGPVPAGAGPGGGGTSFAQRLRNARAGAVSGAQQGLRVSRGVNNAGNQLYRGSYFMGSGRRSGGGGGDGS